MLGGIAPALLWIYHLSAVLNGRSKAAHRLRIRTFLSFLTLILAWIGVTLAQSYQFGTIPPINERYPKTFNRFWRAVDRAYPYFDQKGVDWDEIYSEYLPRVEEATEPSEFHNLVAEMLLPFHDSHTSLIRPGPDTRCCFAFTREIEGRAIAVTVGETARQAGMQRGDEILSVRGAPVADALSRINPRLLNASTPWQKRAYAFMYLLSLDPDEDNLEVTFMKPDGRMLAAQLAWTASGHERRSSSTDAPEPIIAGELLDSGIALIRVPTLSGSIQHDLVAEFDAALDPVMKAPGIILDLRGNGGGDSRLGDAMVGRFLAEPFLYGREHFPQPLAIRGFLRQAEYVVSPRGSQYSGPLIVLIDERVVSSSEWFVVALVDSGRAATVGRRTAGSSGNPLTFDLGDGGLVRFSSGDFNRIDGTPLEGHGVQPDYPVEWQIEDILRGYDPDLEKAETLLLNEPLQ